MFCARGVGALEGEDELETKSSLVSAEPMLKRVRYSERT